MKARLRLSVIGIMVALVWGCSEDSATSPLGAAGAAGLGTPAAGTAGVATPAPIAGTTPSAAGKTGTGAAGVAATGPAGQAAPGAGGTTATPPTGAGGAPAVAGTGAVAGAAAPVAGVGGTGTPSASPFPQLPRVTTTDGPGPFKEVVKVKDVPPGGWMIYPKEIGKDGIKHPLFVFGPGGGTNPMTYESMGMHWDRYGSYGFVIWCAAASGQDGSVMKKGLDWLIAQNDVKDSPLYQHLDTSKVTASGHSMGSIMTFALMPDDRVTTTIHISGGSFDGMGSSHLKNDTMFLCGPDEGADVAFPQCETDFTATKVPTFYTNIQGSSHLTSGRMGWPAIIAWMLWHTAGQEDQWKKEFVEPTGMFQMGQYKSQTKNW